MRSAALLVVVLCACAGAPESDPLPSAPPTAPTTRAAPLAPLTWMIGRWTTGEGPDRFEEEWSAPTARTMVGVGREVASGRMRFFEDLRIEARPDGVYYVAAPGGGSATAFRLVELESDLARFENPEHDFPTSISYHREPSGELIARVEGTRDGTPAGFELRFQRR